MCHTLYYDDGHDTLAIVAPRQMKTLLVQIAKPHFAGWGYTQVGGRRKHKHQAHIQFYVALGLILPRMVNSVDASTACVAKLETPNDQDLFQNVLPLPLSLSIFVCRYIRHRAVTHWDVTWALETRNALNENTKWTITYPPPRWEAPDPGS